MPVSPALVVALPRKKTQNLKKEDDIVLRRPLPLRIPRQSKSPEVPPILREI